MPTDSQWAAQVDHWRERALRAEREASEADGPEPIKCQNCGSMNTWYDPGEGWSCGSCWLTDLTPAHYQESKP